MPKTKRFAPREGSRQEVPAVPSTNEVNATQDSAQKDQPAKKTEAPKLPVKTATKNDALGCVVVVDNNMTYFGTEDMADRGAYRWRVVYSQDRVKKLFDKIDAINADAALDTPEKKSKKIAEAFKSFTSPLAKVPWTHRLESAMPVAPVETAATVETPKE